MEPPEKSVEIVTFDEEGWRRHLAGPVDELQREVSRRGASTAAAAMSEVGEVIGNSDAYNGLFPSTAWGRVVWRRSVGLPMATPISEAFDFVHQYEFLEWVIGADGNPISIGGWVDAHFKPRIWDGPHDDEFYRVSYMLQAPAPWRNALGVSLVPGVVWAPPAPPWFKYPRKIVYPPATPEFNGGIFTPDRNAPIRLPDINVYMPFP